MHAVSHLQQGGDVPMIFDAVESGSCEQLQERFCDVIKKDANRNRNNGGKQIEAPQKGPEEEEGDVHENDNEFSYADDGIMRCKQGYQETKSRVNNQF